MELAGSSLTQTFPIWLDSPPTTTISHNDEATTTTTVNDFQLPDLDDFFLNLISNTNETGNNETLSTAATSATTAAAAALPGSSAAAVGNKYLENTSVSAAAAALDLFDWNGDEFLLALDDLNFTSTNDQDKDDDINSVALVTDRIDSPSAEITYSNVNNEMDVEQLSSMTMTSDQNTFMSSARSSTAQFYDESSSSTTGMPYSPAPSSLYAAAPTSVGLTTTSGDWKRVRHKAIDKKESNKAAAERYRFKKLREKEMLFGECELFAKKNADLKRKISDIQSEISFIKSLLVEALIAKTSASFSS